MAWQAGQDPQIAQWTRMAVLFILILCTRGLGRALDKRRVKMSKAILTIDDVPSRNTPAVFDYLTARKIQPIYYAIGRNMEQYPQEILYLVRNGAIVGNHSYSHPHFSDLTYEECIGEIEKQEHMLDALHQYAGVARRYKLFRFPYIDKGGENKERLQAYLRANGFDRLDDERVLHADYRAKGWGSDIDASFTFDFAEYNVHHKEGVTFEDIIENVKKNQNEGAALRTAETEQIMLLHAHDETEERVSGYYQTLVELAEQCGVAWVSPAFIM